MALPSSGPLSLADIQGEFSGANPIGIDEYYQGAGTGYVTASNYTPPGQIPTSGNPISIADFYGVAKIVNYIFNDVVSASMNNYNLSTRATSAGWNGTVPLIATITVNSGVYIGSTTIGAAFVVGSLPAGSTISLTNNGTIAGKGGNAGAGGSVSGTTFTAGGVGSPGGLGMSISYPISITNAGTIGGGGGGGGGGAAGYTDDGGKPTPTSYRAGGGGGGGGRGAAGIGGTNSIGGAAGTASGTGNNENGVAGTGGTNLVAGGGGVGGTPGLVTGGAGGAGGNLGQSGAAGGVATGPGVVSGGAGAGGAAGDAITGGANITWNQFGTRLGNIDNPGINNTGAGDPVPSQDGRWTEYADGLSAPQTAGIRFASDGAAYYSGALDNYNGAAPSWATPTTAGTGSSYYLRVETSNPTWSSGTFGTYQLLNVDRTYSVFSNTLNQIRIATFTFYLSTTNSDTGLIRTWTGNTFTAYPNNL